MAQILVVGGGTAGIGAAIAAGRMGGRVTLVEATGALGGVMATCPGMPWGGGWPAGAPIGGLMTELTDRLAAMDPPAAEVRPCTLANFGPEILYDPDMAALLLAEMLAEAGVVHLPGTLVTEVERVEERIVSVQGVDRQGAFTLRPDILLATVAVFAGVAVLIRKRKAQA